MGSTLRPYITSSENVLVIDPPPSIKRNVQENDDDTFVFQETTCAPLAQDLVVDRASDGNFSGNSSEGATIPAGTLAATFIVLVDRANSGTNVGSVSFSDPILGLSYRRPSFEAGTAQFGIPGLCYPTTTGTYFEGNDAPPWLATPSPGPPKWAGFGPMLAASLWPVESHRFTSFLTPPSTAEW